MGYRTMGSKAKMPWLKNRLREINKTPTALAKALKIEPPRVYEMIGGRRAMQPDEIKPTAKFLGWSITDLLARLPKEARVLPLGTRNGGLEGPRLRSDRDRVLYLVFTLERVNSMVDAALKEIELTRKPLRIE